MVISVRPPVAIVTGAASGVGAAIAQELGTIGATVVLTSLPSDDLTAAAEQVVRAGGTAVPVALDVRDHRAADSLTAEVVDRFGGIDLLAANAGIADQSTIADGDPERWRAVVETNLLGVGVLRATSSPGDDPRPVRPHFYYGVDLREGNLYRRAAVHRQQVGTCRFRPRAPGGGGSTRRKGYVDRTEPDRHAANARQPEAGKLDERRRPLQPVDVAHAVLYVFQQPERVSITELVLRPMNEGTWSPEAVLRSDK